MGRLISVMGFSGSGKSSSILGNKEFNIKGLNPEETFIINVAGKDLPARGSMKKYPLGVKPSEGGRHIILSDPYQISDLIGFISSHRQDIKQIVIDDAGYIMGFDTMANAKRKNFDKWTDLAVNFYTVIEAAKKARYDLKIIFLFHTEVGKDERLKIKTSGAMLDNNILLDGLFTVNLESTIKKEGDRTIFGFQTNATETSTRKTPAGMFKEDFIPNDLGYVVEEMDRYFMEEE